MNIDQFLIYDELPLWSAPFGLKLLDTIKMQKNISILDIGSGSGFPLLEIASRFGESCTAYGLDPSDEAVKMITHKIRVKGINNVRIIRKPAEEIPFSDGYFQLITANNGFNNVQDERRVLQECFRVAAKGAQMVTTMNLPATMRQFYDVFRKVLSAEGFEDKTGKLDDHIFKKRKPSEYWENLITEEGFEIRSASEDVFRYRFTDGTSFLKHFFIKTAFLGSWREVAGDENSERIFSLTEKELNSSASAKGELIIDIPFICFDCAKV